MVRIDVKFERKLKEISRDRLILGTDLDLRPRSVRELTEMTLNCPSFQNVEAELKKLRRRKDLR